VSLPLVSIGMAIYNRPNSLKIALNSIKNQTYSNLEIIVSDDCSPNKEVAFVVEQFITNGMHITFYKQNKNLGSIANWDFVLRQSTGKYFLWADDEDYFDSRYIEKLVDCMEFNPDLVACVSDINLINHNGDFINTSLLDTIRLTANWDDARLLFFKYPASNIFFCILGMFRTEIIKKTNIFYHKGWCGYATNGEVPHLAQLATFGRIASLPEPLKTYRLNPDSVYHSEMASISDFDLFMLRLVVRLRLCKIAINNNLPLKVKISLFKTVIFSWLVSIKDSMLVNIVCFLRWFKRIVKD